MKTTDLIDRLAADAPAASDGRRAWTGLLALALLVAGGLGLALMAAVGWRPAPPVLESWFWMKCAYAAALLLAACPILLRLGRPGGDAGAWPLGLAAIVLFMAAAGAVHLAGQPASERMALWRGATWTTCPIRILLLSVPAYGCLVLMLRRMAPTNLAGAGAAAGAVAGALATALYAFYCRETAPAFVATWYTLGVMAASLLGAVLGPRTLRW